MSVNRERNQLRAALKREHERVLELEAKLAERDREIRIATGLLRDVHKSTAGIGAFLEGKP